jgi:hypothetical protein
MLQGKPCRIYVALLHHSMRDKAGKIVTTAVTNLDIHDIARASRTFGVSGYFLVTPLEEQQTIVKRIVGHWQTGFGKEYNPNRSEAFGILRVVSWLGDAIEAIATETKLSPLVVMTSARDTAGVCRITSEDMRKLIGTQERPILLVFGTGWGMVEELLRTADWVMDPIEAEREADYNHLSVRAAVAIYLDRLLGKRA